jgi:hypothetical protein
MNLTDEPLATVDLGNFESNIDRAIDELFVHKGAAVPPPPKEEAPAAAAPPTKVAPAPKAGADLLQGLKESLLSLDWEISAENIQKFERELDRLREQLGQDRHSLAVVKMALGVCKYLRAMKYSASAVSVQFLHSATRTLDLLQKKPQLSPAERRDLMDKMLTKFRRLKAEVQRMKAVKATEPKAPPPPEPPIELAPEPLVAEEPEPLPAEEEEPILELEPLPEVEEAALEPELVFPEEKEEPLLAAKEEEIELPAEEEELVFPTDEEKPMAHFREDTLELRSAHAEPRFARAPEPEMDEPLFEIEEAAPEPTPEVPAGWLARLEEVRACSKDLTQSLGALGQENDSLFGRLLQAVTGKPALQKVSDYFSEAHRHHAEKLSRAQQSAARLGEMLAALGQPPSGGEMRELPPGERGAVSIQLREIKETLLRLSDTVRSLEESSPSPPAAAGGDAVTRELQEPITLDTPSDLEEIPESEGAQDIPVVGEVFESQQPGAPPSSVGQIYLTNVAGTTVGIPTQAVAHVFKVSKGKAKAVRKRGHATLADFKAPFRSIKRGLTGPLAEQPVKALKTVKFPLINLSPEVVGADAAGVEQAPAKGIVILSDGQRHGSVLTEDLLEKRPYEVLGFRQAGLPADVIGTATIEGGFDINVLNLDRLLS